MVVFMHKKRKYTSHFQKQTLEGVLRLFLLSTAPSLSLSQFLSNFMCLPLFTLIFSYICPTFFLGMCCPYTVGELLIQSGSCFPTFMINRDCQGYLHCSNKSFINKFNYAKQVNLINAKVTIALPKNFSRLPQTTLHSPEFFLSSSTSVSSSVAQQVFHPRLVILYPSHGSVFD